MTRAYKYAPISPQPGVNPIPDNTNANTPYWTYTDKVRFYDGMLRKLGGWQQLNTTGASISGVCRRIFSYTYQNKIKYLIATHSYLYELVQGVVTNITPLNTAKTLTLGANPITTVNTSKVVTIADTTAGRVNGTRIKFAGAALTNGISAASLNKEFIIFNVVANTSFQITTDTAATSSGSGGGVAVDLFDQIAAGEIDYALGFGYGGGKYGVGLYGVGKTFVSTFKIPRIWSIDRFGNDVVLTPGNQGKVYIYQNDNTVAPTVLTNSPSTADFLFVENSAVCVISKNTFSSSDIGNATIWTPDATNLAFSVTIPNCDGWMASVPIRAGRLLMTGTQIWTLQYIGSSSGIWAFKLIDTTVGLLSPLAVVSINGVAYWVGIYDVCTFDGSSVRNVPNTVKQYVISTQSPTQFYKSFIRVDRAFNELWLHYPTLEEPSNYAIFNINEGHFTIGTMDRTAAESPSQADFNQVTIDSNNVLWYQESGSDDGVNAMLPIAQTNYFELGEGDTIMKIMNVVPDSTQSGDINMTISTKMRPQSAPNTTAEYTIAPDSEQINVRATGRLAQYTFSQDELGDFFIMGGWKQGVQEGTLR